MNDMYVTRLEVQGFKTFAKKSVLTFLPPGKSHHSVTSIVGPNGSGKSNMADAIRWVLGEQSMKMLRGKKSEDIIFSGSKARARSGFAEVSITFNNEKKEMPLEVAEVTITRRLYRDGQSEYLVNNRTARLADIHLLLAEANVGQRSYSVIGQGMVDHILVATPEERKAFFDDATGVKPLQLKRHSAMLKLKRTYENVAEAQMLLQEITPRLRSLKRQVSRLEKRDAVEEQLFELEEGYYGTLWWKLSEQLETVRKKEDKIKIALQKEKEEWKTLEHQMDSLDTQEEETPEEDQGLTRLQKQYREKQTARRKVRDTLFETKREIELAKVRAQSKWTPLPLLEIIKELEAVVTGQKSLLKNVKDESFAKNTAQVEKEIAAVLKRSETLVQRLQRPAPEDIKTDPALLKKVEETEKEIAELDKEIKNIETELETTVVKEKKVRQELIDLQKKMRQKQQVVYQKESEYNQVRIELARLEERQQNLLREINEQVRERSGIIRKNKPEKFVNTEAVYPEIQKLRYKLELIGGIDPEIVQEYEEIKVRHEFLSSQVADLEEAIASTEKVIDELDKEIKSRSETTFKAINKEFQKYFKLLFGGGTCALVKLAQDDEPDEVEVTPDRVSSDTGELEREKEEETIEESIKRKIRAKQDRVIGIEIQATPPGKRLKALNLLSGGERALTSIALLSAIMSVNPSPFVVLDEVDAALDEANTFRFANILDELSKLTQFIIITHNRATMSKSDVLYGVTMGDDAVSSLLSVNIQDIDDIAAARG